MIFGLQMLLFPFALRMPADIVGAPSGVYAYAEHSERFPGLYLLAIGAATCLISLTSYRQGERWAWYVMIVLGIIALVGSLVLFATWQSAIYMSFPIPVSTIPIILWAIGITLPVKDVFTSRKA